jgi:hypothetical protein
MKILIVVLSHLDGGVYTKFFETQNESWNSIDVEGVETFFWWETIMRIKLREI